MAVDGFEQMFQSPMYHPPDILLPPTLPLPKSPSLSLSHSHPSHPSSSLSPPHSPTTSQNHHTLSSISQTPEGEKGVRVVRVREEGDGGGWEDHREVVERRQRRRQEQGHADDVVVVIHDDGMHWIEMAVPFPIWVVMNDLLAIERSGVSDLLSVTDIEADIEADIHVRAPMTSASTSAFPRGLAEIAYSLLTWAYSPINHHHQPSPLTITINHHHHHLFLLALL